MPYLKVALVDDSAVMRSYIRSLIAPLPQARILAECTDGRQALALLPTLQPDVILLDIEMPNMSGLDVLPHLKKTCPNAAILMCSTLTVAGAEATFEALSNGATDFLGKPTAQDVAARPAFEADLKAKLTGLYDARFAKAPLQTRPQAQLSHSYKDAPQIVAIGVSTGGPKALPVLLKDLKNLPFPIVITQHMPSPFTRIFAEQLEKECGRTCREVSEPFTLQPQTTYIAQGGTHMGFRSAQGRVEAYPETVTPPRQYCKPAVDVMLEGLLPHYKNHILAVILTGMGQDGLDGVKQLIKVGGTCLAQDRETSTVFGMPKAVIEAGLSAAAPLPRLGEIIMKRFSKGVAT